MRKHDVVYFKSIKNDVLLSLLIMNCSLFMRFKLSSKIKCKFHFYIAEDWNQFRRKNKYNNEYYSLYDNQSL